MTIPTRTRITLIGYGNIAHSLLTGLLAAGYEANCISISDPYSAKLKEMNQQTTGPGIFTSNIAAVTDATLVILCVKPNVVQTVCAEIKELLIKQTTLLISVAAGVSIKLLQRWTSPTLAIIRCMPNTPAAVGCGMTALYANQCATDSHKKLTEDIFVTMGSTLWLKDEQDMHIVTALSGSGPAYFFRLTEAFANAAERLNIPTETAHKLAVQTLYGAANLAAQSKLDLAMLRKQITSRGGTTEYGLNALEQADIDQIAQLVLAAARHRSVEISEQLEED